MLQHVVGGRRQHSDPGAAWDLAVGRDAIADASYAAARGSMTTSELADSAVSA